MLKTLEGGGTGRPPATRTVRRWAVIALVAHVAFVLTWLVAPLWQPPGYRVLAHSISDMYATGVPGAWVLIVVFTLCGAALVGFATRSVWPMLRPAGRPAAIGSLLLALSAYGVGDLSSAFGRLPCSQAEPGCTAAAQLAESDGVVHSVISAVGLLLFAVAFLFLGSAMSRLSGWTRYAWAARGLALLFVALCVVTGQVGPLGLVGLFQRVGAATGAVGIVALALAVLHRAPAPAPRRP
ncbi:DUF998 domain-containing protein [Pseudonocardia xinjiangensis]|uniref:DUF998 domain-containing protein n=1 Tax=Pseudonocardia xinjiangensis TaxID=75289 RepID=UPI003D8A1831